MYDLEWFELDAGIRKCMLVEGGGVGVSVWAAQLPSETELEMGFSELPVCALIP